MAIDDRSRVYVCPNNLFVLISKKYEGASL